jgi:formylglycine-generating enzyme required for sulfatase activity
MARIGIAAALCLIMTGAAMAAPVYVEIPAGPLVGVLAGGAGKEPVRVEPFALREMPVTHGEFRNFVATHPEWRRDRIPAAFAETGYLRHWKSDDSPGDEIDPAQPVTEVSWFAAQAYCESEDARLPTWNEWEYVAAADETRQDARRDPAWRSRILSWYNKPAGRPQALVGGIPNLYGIRDLHGLIWEWVEDFNALMVSADSRNQGDPDKLQFCGAGAISLQNRENFAVLMRVALLSSLAATDTTGNLGFRCARSLNKELSK